MDATRDQPTPPPGQEPLTGLRRVRRLLRNDRERIAFLTTAGRQPLAGRAAVDRALRRLNRIELEVADRRPAPAGRAVVLLPAVDLLAAYLETVLAASTLAARVTAVLPATAAPEAHALYRLLEAGRNGKSDPDGPTADRLPEAIREADIVLHTGGYPDAERLRHTLAPDQFFGYLGQGINPVLVGPDADPDRAAGDLIDSGVLRLGRRRLLPGPVLVHVGLVERFVATLTTRLALLGRHPDTGPGPLEDDQDCAAAAARLLRHGADIVHGGEIDFPSRTLAPTVLRLRPGDRIEAVEPVPGLLTVAPYDDPVATVAALHRGRFAEYALGATVYGAAPDLAEALSRLRTVAVDRSLDALADDGTTVTGRGPMAGYTAYQGRLSLAPGPLIAQIADTLGRTAEPVGGAR